MNETFLTSNSIDLTGTQVMCTHKQPNNTCCLLNLPYGIHIENRYTKGMHTHTHKLHVIIRY